jgi:hypothetical protein
MLSSADGSSLVFFEPLELSAAVERLERFELTARLLSDVPNVAGQKMTICARHRFVLRGSVLTGKTCF